MARSAGKTSFGSSGAGDPIHSGEHMRPIATFVLTPVLPARLASLRDLAMNLRWAWDHATVDLFRRIDPALWEATGHNPIRLLAEVDQRRLEAAATDEGFLAQLDRAARTLEDYVAEPSTWFARKHGSSHVPLAAYFSAEFGLAESLPIFAGGLGVLAGDHLKSASDLGVPLVGLGLLYRQGYFRQRITASGRQREVFEDADLFALPLAGQRTRGGAPLLVHVGIAGREVDVRVSLVRVGRVPLILLDTDLDTNAPADRAITQRLYGGDEEIRLQQEIVLGIGGIRALTAMGLEPMVCHMNEGHAAFLALERARQLMERHGIDFAVARELAASGLVFTTHTPVPAGHDRFSPDLMVRYLREYAGTLGLSWTQFLDFGRARPGDEREPFTMTILALRLAARANGVSRMHAATSRAMWSSLWPALPEAEIPIGHVTNGVHLPSWVSEEVADLYERYVGPQWRDSPVDVGVWDRVLRIPGAELWRAHERCRERLVSTARARLRARLERLGASASELAEADEALDPGALTIVFARRFATYKRAWLLFRDPDRLARLLALPARPVQVIVAGKAHPRDEQGKDIIHRIAALAGESRFRRRVLLLEDYDLSLARSLVQGADVWLNTPLPPNEASGTSGMKAGANGAINVSTLDGWWAEAWTDACAGQDRPASPIGWTVTEGEADVLADERDAQTADALYQLLEAEVVPTFYERGADGLPRRWLERMRSGISFLATNFGAHRMVREYVERCYIPAHANAAALAFRGAEAAQRLAAWRARVERNWPQLRVVAVQVDIPRELPAGTAAHARASVHLGELSPREVRVELCVGPVDSEGDLGEMHAVEMDAGEQMPDGVTVFVATATLPRSSGAHGIAVRVLARHPDLATCLQPGLIAWAPAHVVSRGVMGQRIAMAASAGLPAG